LVILQKFRRSFIFLLLAFNLIPSALLVDIQLFVFAVFPSCSNFPTYSP
jgi:hypothetical protein